MLVASVMRAILTAIVVALSSAAVGQTIVAAPYVSNINGFIITEGDIADRPYDEIGPVSARQGKASLVFQRSPTRESVNIRLTEAARQMGAEAVIRVRYTPLGASALSWGGLRADGVAIRYRREVNTVPSEINP